jgi:hypothetical protein
MLTLAPTLRIGQAFRMRFYVYTPGSPGYISAEVAVRELTDEHEARAWAEELWPPATYEDERRFISRAETLMVPLYRDALERWEARDDSILQGTEVAEIRASRRASAASFAELGCREAAAAVAAHDDERIRFAIMEHCHDERCGGRDFPDEPPTRHLSAVR